MKVLFRDWVASGKCERASQRELLRAIGCRRGQGYHFAHPLDAEGVAALLGGTAVESERVLARV